MRCLINIGLGDKCKRASERQAINIKRVKSIFEKRMYKNRPSKQQERKGMELMKNLIMSHKKTSQLNQSKGHIWSSTSFSKGDHKEQNQLNQKTVDRMLVQSAQLIKSDQKAYLTINSRGKDNPQMMRKTLGSKQNMNLVKNILNENSQIKTNDDKEETSLQKGKLLKEDATRKSIQQLYLPTKGISQPLIELPKLAPQYRKAKQKTTEENIHKLQKELVVQKEQIKNVRREFMEVLQNGKRFMLQFQKDQRQISSQSYFIQFQVGKFSLEKTKRLERTVVIGSQLSEVETMLSGENYGFDTSKSNLQEKIMSKQQLNSATARKIYHLKNQLNSINEQTHNLHKKDQRNKSLIQTIISKQQHINNLQLRKSTLVSQRKQRLKDFVKSQIQIEDKTHIYQKLDSQLNLIKEYFKISQNANQFKRTLKKLSQFEPFYKQIETFTKSPSYSEEIMLLYRSSLWNTEKPKFFESQPLILESPQIRLLKNTYKQLELKRQSLNDYLKEKQKFVDSLSYRFQKLVEQITHLEAKKQIKEEQLEMSMLKVNRNTIDKINWGF